MGSAGGSVLKLCVEWAPGTGGVDAQRFIFDYKAIVNPRREEWRESGAIGSAGVDLGALGGAWPPVVVEEVLEP